MTTLYFVKRIYKDKKYLSLYWQKEYGNPGDPIDRINSKFEKAGEAMDKYLSKDEIKHSSRELNTADIDDNDSSEEG